MSEWEVLRHHRACHEPRGPVAVESCAKCAIDRNVCERKRVFAHWATADDLVRLINETTEYARPVTRYRCRWCDFWHLTSRMNRDRARRVEKARRRWLTEREYGRRRRPELVTP